MKVKAVMCMVLSAFIGATAWSQQLGGGFSERMMAQMKERTIQMLTRLGITDKERDATIEMWTKKFESFSPVMETRRALMMAIRDGDAESAAKGLAAYQHALKKYAQQAEDFDKTLDAKIEFTKKPQLQAALTVTGIIGVNVAPSMQMFGGGAGQKEGTLKVGDAAPDFLLYDLGGKNPVKLSQFKSKMPVVLVFGSYT